MSEFACFDYDLSIYHFSRNQMVKHSDKSQIWQSKGALLPMPDTNCSVFKSIWVKKPSEPVWKVNFKKLCFAEVVYYLFCWKLLKKFFIKWTGLKSKNIGISSANGFLMGMVKVPPPSSLKNRQLVRCPSVRTDRIWKPISISFLRTFKKCDWRFSAVRETIGMKQMRSSYQPETEEMKKDSKVLVGSSFSCPKKDPPIYSTLWVEYTWKWEKNI